MNIINKNIIFWLKAIQWIVIWSTIGLVCSSRGYSQHSIYKLEFPVNTPQYDEISPVLTNDGRLLFFTRTGDPDCNKTLMINGVNLADGSAEEYNQMVQKIYTQIAGRILPNPLLTSYNQDVWFTWMKENRPEGIAHPGYPMNSILPNSICSGYDTGSRYIVINQFDKSGGMSPGFSVVEMYEDSFSFPTPIVIDKFRTSGTEINLTAGKEGEVLIIAMPVEVRSRNMDLYVSLRKSKDVYGEPIRLGDNINTIYRESTPKLSADLSRLYFSSDRPGGFGGADIYYVERLDSTFLHWSAPVRLIPPVNSPADDSYPYPSDDSNYIYFTSNRDGSSDIFQAQMIRQPLLQELKVTIHIIDGNTGKKAPSEVKWGDAYQPDRPGFFITKNGIFQYIFKENKPVVFSASNRGLESPEVIVDPQDMVNQKITEVIIELVLPGKLELTSGSVAKVESPVINALATHEKFLKDNQIEDKIYFERSTDKILLESLPVLKKLADYLHEHKQLNVTVSGHTDNVGNEDALMRLSMERAEAIKSFLVKRGINEERITTHGYGATRAVAPNDTEANKQKNRRVEIKFDSDN